MSCGRVRRELLDTVRFGELGPSSASHLAHLSGCRACRDEVGFDRALVAQLRRALAARVDPPTPPSRAWYAILREAQRPEAKVSVWSWSTTLVVRLRTATAMAGTGLALVLALNMEVIPLTAPDSETPAAEPAEEAALLQVPRLPAARTSLAVLADIANAGGVDTVARPDPEQTLMQAGTRLAPRPRVAASEPVNDSSGPQLRLLVRALRMPEHDPADASASAPNAAVATDAAAGLVELEPGQPS